MGTTLTRAAFRIGALLMMGAALVVPWLPAGAQGPALGDCPVFPTDHIWNTPVDGLPVDSHSAAYIDSIGAAFHPHADFGAGEWPPGSGAPIGIPFVIVPSTQPLVAITDLLYGDESDPGPYPIPADAPIEGGASATGDRHVLVLRRGECVLYELYRAFPNGDGSWRADSAARYALTGYGLRPAGWTSADAAGLPMLPGLARYDEVVSGEIGHALRFTAPSTRRAYVWPARHYASSSTNPDLPPMGQRFRLKADFAIDDSFSPQGRVLLRAMQRYGLILADNGAAWYVSGAPDGHWDNDALAGDFNRVRGDDFEAVDVSSLRLSADSGQIVGFGLAVAPRTQTIPAAGQATFTIAVTFNGAFGQPVFLSAHASPSLPATLSPTIVVTTGISTLTLTDTHSSGPLLPGVWHTVWITTSGGGVTRTDSVRLLVGGGRVFLPLAWKK